MTRKTGMLVAVVLFVILTMIGLSAVRKAQQAKKEAELAAQPINLNMLGGGPTFGPSNKMLGEFNLSKGYTFTIVEEYKICDYDGDWSKIDFAQAGDLNCLSQIRELTNGPVKIYSEQTMSTSPNMIWLKGNLDQNDYQALVDAGYIYVVENNGQMVNTMDSEKLAILVQGAVEGKKFNDPSIGINIDKKINFGFPNSSGGRTSAAQLLSCYFFECQDMLGQEFIVKDADGNDTLRPDAKKALITLFENSGKQAASEYSVDYCFNWLNANTTPVRISVFPESCYGAWMLSLSDSQREIAKERANMGVYITDTVIHTFTLIAVSEEAQEYLDNVVKSEDFPRIVAESTGMRGVGLVSIAPVTLGNFIAPNEPYSPIGFPFGQLTSAEKSDLRNYGK